MIKKYNQYIKEQLDYIEFNLYEKENLNIDEKDNIIEKIHDTIKNIIDNIYRKKGINSKDIKKYFLIKRNFNRLLDTIKNLKFLYEKNNYELKFEDQVRDILFNRILQDRIFYELDNPQNEGII